MKNENTIVTILMATFNDCKYLSKTIESVINQSYKNWEFIIINDASTDTTLSILKKYALLNKRIRIINNKHNIGLTKNLNIGISMAKGKYIARIDGDDMWSDRDKLKQQIDFLEGNKEYGLVGCYANAIDTSDKAIFKISYPSSHEDIKKIMMRHSCFVHSAIVIRKDILMKVNGCNILRKYAQDYDLYLKIGKISKFYNIPQFLVSYRINPEGTSRTKYHGQMDEMQKIISEHKSSYPNYFIGALMWKARKYYPVWFRGAVSRTMKKLVYLPSEL